MLSDGLFTSVANISTLTERAQLQIEELIMRGSLQAGDKLPSERELTENLGVSKTVVREAIRGLVAKGLIEVRPGSGMYVRGLTSKVISQPMKLLLQASVMDPQAIHDVRRVLEIHIAGLAAGNAHPATVEAMADTISALREPKLTARAFAQADVAFHNLLAAGCGNPLFSILADSLNDLMVDLRVRIFQTLGPAVAIERAITYHTNILDRVKAQDVAGAREAMSEHLSVSLRDQLKD